MARDTHTCEIDAWGDFVDFYTPADAERPEIHGGFALSHWCGSPECEAKVNDELAVTIRCIPPGIERSGPGACIVCGERSRGRVVFAKSY